MHRVCEKVGHASDTKAPLTAIARGGAFAGDWTVLRSASSPESEVQPRGLKLARLAGRWAGIAIPEVSQERLTSMPTINGRYYMNPLYGAALERDRAADEAATRLNGEPEPSWLDHFLGLVATRRKAGTN
jgi:hypothetical protein